MTRVIDPDDGRTRIIRAREQDGDALQDAVQHLACALWHEQARREQTVGQLRDAATDMAVVLAEQLLQERLTADPALILNLAAPMLAALRRATELTLYACPRDASRLREALQARTDTTPTIEVQDDAALEPGSLRIHSDMGSLDGRLPLRLARLAAGFRTQPEKTTP